MRPSQRSTRLDCLCGEFECSRFVEQSLKMNSVENVTLIPPIGFFRLMDEVEALPTQKRSKWRGSIKDVDGVRRNVYYTAPGQLLLKRGSELIQLQPVDQEMGKYLEFDIPEAEEIYNRWIRAYERGGWVEAELEHNRMVNENARRKLHKSRGEPTKM